MAVLAELVALNVYSFSEAAESSEIKQDHGSGADEALAAKVTDSISPQSIPTVVIVSVSNELPMFVTITLPCILSPGNASSSVARIVICIFAR